MTKSNAKYSSPPSLPPPKNIGIYLFFPFFLKESCSFIKRVQFFHKNILALSTSIVYFIPKKAKLKTGTFVQTWTACLTWQENSWISILLIEQV